MMLAKANSATEKKINAVHPKHQISEALMYDTFGRELSRFLESVIKVNNVLVPTSIKDSLIMK